MNHLVKNGFANVLKGLAITLLLIYSSSAFADDLKRQGSFGVKVVPVPDAIRAQLRLPANQGVLVEAVSSNGSAQAAGIEAHDIILKVNDADIAAVEQFVPMIRSFHSGDKVTVVLQRANQQITKSFALKPRPFETNPDFDILYKSVGVDNTGRRVIVTKPKSSGKHPALLFLTGIGCGSQDNLPPDNAIAKVLYDFTRKGFVTMRVEKSGVGDSEGAPCTNPQVDLQAEVRGYVAGSESAEGL